jgi:hypothetical protein
MYNLGMINQETKKPYTNKTAQEDTMADKYEESWTRSGLLEKHLDKEVLFKLINVTAIQANGSPITMQMWDATMDDAMNRVMDWDADPLTERIIRFYANIKVNARKDKIERTLDYRVRYSGTPGEYSTENAFELEGVTYNRGDA